MVNASCNGISNCVAVAICEEIIDAKNALKFPLNAEMLRSVYELPFLHFTGKLTPSFNYLSLLFRPINYNELSAAFRTSVAFWSFLSEL